MLYINSIYPCQLQKSNKIQNICLRFLITMWQTLQYLLWGSMLPFSIWYNGNLQVKDCRQIEEQKRQISTQKFHSLRSWLNCLNSSSQTPSIASGACSWSQTTDTIYSTHCDEALNFYMTKDKPNCFVWCSATLLVLLL